MWVVFVYIFCLSYAEAGQNETFLPFPRFWTNTGFCPSGNITHNDISNFLISNEVKINLQLIGSLPNSGLSHVRIHWLLELIELIELQKPHVPSYDFSKLDKLVWWLDRNELSLGFELMGNPSQIFSRFKENEELTDFLWQDLAFQIGKRYLNRLGPSKIGKWKFESWNEPDLKGYNILGFDIQKFQNYLSALRRGLNAAARRPLNSINFKLHGPAGLFKNPVNHPLCWEALQNCNYNPNECVFDVLTFHRKGSGNSHDVANGGELLLEEIFYKFPNLSAIPVANDEADPISGWATPRDFQADVRYAVKVVSIIFDHWTAKLELKTFKNLDYISHDNAFISYHPYEFNQRTLFAHFRMNNSKPHPYSQFIQKPVYVALGLMGNLATLAADVEVISEKGRLLKTINVERTYLSLIAISEDETSNSFHKDIIFKDMKGSTFSYIIEYLEYEHTDPVLVWNYYGSPPFPNSTIMEIMRRNQGPKLYTTGTLFQPILLINIPVSSPWLFHIRMCSDLILPPKPPKKLQILSINSKEVLLSWKEQFNVSRCVVTYQVWFLPLNQTEWKDVSIVWHIPFLSFVHAPKDERVKGSYIVRSVDTFGRLSEFSKARKYM